MYQYHSHIILCNLLVLLVWLHQLYVLLYVCCKFIIIFSQINAIIIIITFI